MRRWRCPDPGCATVTFAEQIPGLTRPHARFTPLAVEMIEAIGLALAGRAGARLAARLGMTVGRDALLRRVRALPDPAQGPLAVLGVDDFALRRSPDYGTVLVDMDSHRPVDLLPGRPAEPFAQWLTAHPGIGVICRDRTGQYAAGATSGAPEAVQVADRYHLWANLGEAVAKTVTAHRAALRDTPPDVTLSTLSTDGDEGPSPAPAQAAARDAAAGDAAVAHAGGVVPEVVNTVPEKAILVRTRERYRQIHALLDAGASRNEVARSLNLDIQTVRRFANATTVQEVLAPTLERHSTLDEFKEHLHRRWNEGITSTAALTREICGQGHTGSVQTITRYLHRFPGALCAPPPGATVPTIRQTSRWLMTRPDRLAPEDRACLEARPGTQPRP
ncbi:MAG: hypothetical protein QG671_532 [Actinomycetota bacterium]|nr:hypothetical protein [Actinomycetota bacterium]